jgi:hypothetical protein
MARDDRDPIEVLKFELNFIEKGGYGRSVRTPWKEERVFRDSVTRLHTGEALKSEPAMNAF